MTRQLVLVVPFDADKQMGDQLLSMIQRSDLGAWGQLEVGDAGDLQDENGEPAGYWYLNPTEPAKAGDSE